MDNIKRLQRGMYITAVTSPLWLWILWLFAIMGYFGIGLICVVLLGLSHIARPMQIKDGRKAAEDSGKEKSLLQQLLGSLYSFHELIKLAKIGSAIALFLWLGKTESVVPLFTEVMNQAGSFNPYLVALVASYTLICMLKNIQIVHNTSDDEIRDFYRDYTPLSVKQLFNWLHARMHRRGKKRILPDQK